MKSYKNLNYILIMLFIILYPILPTYGKYSSDIIIYLLIFFNILEFLFIKDYRDKVLCTIKYIYKDKIFISIILLNLCMYLSTFVAINKRVTITNSIRFSLYVFIFYLISYTIENKKQISIILNSFILTALLSSLVSIYQIVKLISIGEKLNSNNRISSFLENSNNLGAYTILSLFIVIMLIIQANKKSYKLLYGLLSLLLLINIISSESRNSLIGVLIGVLIVAVLYDKRFIIISIILPVILFIVPQSRLRILQILDPSQNESRFKIWKTAKLIIKDHAILGIGYENFQFQYPIYVNNNSDTLLVSDSYLALHPHNIFLKFQSELGILGTLFLVLFLVITIATLINLIYKHNDKNVSYTLIGITSGFIALQFMNLIDNFYSAPKILISMFVVIGIANYYKLNWNSRYK